MYAHDFGDRAIKAVVYSVSNASTVAFCMAREVLVCDLSRYNDASFSYDTLTQDRDNLLIECPYLPEEDSIIGVVFSGTTIRSVVAIHSVTFTVSFHV